MAVLIGFIMAGFTLLKIVVARLLIFSNAVITLFFKVVAVFTTFVFMLFHVVDRKLFTLLKIVVIVFFISENFVFTLSIMDFKVLAKRFLRYNQVVSKNVFIAVQVVVTKDFTPLKIVVILSFIFANLVFTILTMAI